MKENREEKKSKGKGGKEGKNKRKEKQKSKDKQTCEKDLYILRNSYSRKRTIKKKKQNKK